MTDTALITRNEATALTVPQEISNAVIPGMETMDRDDMMIPRLVLCQAQSSDLPDNGSHLGEWYNSMTGEYYKSVEGVMLGVSKGRVMFPEKFSRESSILCGSDNAINPRQEYIGTNVNGVDIPHDCAACPFSQFSEDGAPPACAKGYQFAFVDTNGVPFIVRLQRTGTQSAKQLVMIGKTIRRSRVIRFASKLVKGDSGNYYEPVISLADKTSDEMLITAAYMSDLGNLAARQVPTADDVLRGSGDIIDDDQPTGSDDIPW